MMNQTLQTWLDGPANVVGKTCIVRPSIDAADWDKAVQHVFGSLSFGCNWPGDRESHARRMYLWDGKSEICPFISPFTHFWDDPGWEKRRGPIALNQELTWRDIVNECDRVRMRLVELREAMTPEQRAEADVTVTLDMESMSRVTPLGAYHLDLTRPMLRHVVQDVFPHADIEWYDCGGVRPAKTDTGWGTTKRWNKGYLEEVESSVSLYTLDDYQLTREQFRMTTENSLFGGPAVTVTPWLGVRCAYHRTPYQPDVRWSSDHDFDLGHMARLGLEIAQPKHCRYCDWSKVRRVWFWTPSGTATGDHGQELDLDGDLTVERIEAALPYFDAFRRGAIGEWVEPSGEADA